MDIILMQMKEKYNIMKIDLFIRYHTMDAAYQAATKTKKLLQNYGKRNRANMINAFNLIQKTNDADRWFVDGQKEMWFAKNAILKKIKLHETENDRYQIAIIKNAVITKTDQYIVSSEMEQHKKDHTYFIKL